MTEKLRQEFNDKVKHHDFNMNAKMDMVNDDLLKRIEGLTAYDAKQ